MEPVQRTKPRETTNGKGNANDVSFASCGSRALSSPTLMSDRAAALPIAKTHARAHAGVRRVSRAKKRRLWGRKAPVGVVSV